MARHCAAILDARLVAQNYSRLVIDCNRDPSVASSIPVSSDGREIPGNQRLSPADATARRTALFDPYHAHLAAVLDERAGSGRATFLVAQHSMTDVLQGVRRNMHVAVLYNRDRRFAGLWCSTSCDASPDSIVADNEPYFVSDATDHTIPRHGEGRGLPHVEIEIRQDLVSPARPDSVNGPCASRAHCAAHARRLRRDPRPTPAWSCCSSVHRPIPARAYSQPWWPWRARPIENPVRAAHHG